MLLAAELFSPAAGVDISPETERQKKELHKQRHEREGTPPPARMGMKQIKKFVDVIRCAIDMQGWKSTKILLLASLPCTPASGPSDGVRWTPVQV